MFSEKITLQLISDLQAQKNLLLSEFYKYIEYDNLLVNKEFLRNITPQTFKAGNGDMDYYDVFFEISSRLDFISNFRLKTAIIVYLNIKKYDSSGIILEHLFSELK